MINNDKHAPFAALLLCVLLSTGCATLKSDAVRSAPLFSINEAGYVQGKDKLEKMIRINHVMSEWYSDSGDATFRYACDVRQMNEALQNIYEYTFNSNTQIEVSFASGPLKTRPFGPLATDAEPERYGLTVYVVKLGNQVDYSGEDLEWMIHFEFNVTSDEMRELSVPGLLPINHGGELGSFIEFHENRRTERRLNGNDFTDTTWPMFKGSFEESNDK